MTKTPRLSRKPDKVITIIGGGFSGSTIAVQQAQHYISLFEKNRSLPPLTIRIIDQNGSFGPGLPYGAKNNIFLLNQPASAMSPFPDNPDDFTKWLGGNNGDAFATRQQYGDYLQETLFKTFRDAKARGIPLRLETVTGEVADLTRNGECLTLLQKENICLQTDATIIATGHQKSGLLKGFDGNTGYFSGIYGVSSVDNILKGSSAQDSVLIVGTGQSMMDALALLDHIGYKGKIYAASRHLAEPWPYDPALYNKALPPYAPYYLDPARIGKIKDPSFRALRLRLYREFRRAKRRGYGIGHVLTALDFAKLAAAGPDGTAPQGLDELHGLWEKIYGNPTAPDRYALFERYKKGGQLVLIGGHVVEEMISADENGFAAKDLARKKPLRLSAIFNAASFSRSALASPLLQKAAARGLLSMDGAAVRAGRQNHPALFVAGPSTRPGKWGVETFRFDNAKTAKLSVETALGLNNPQQQRRNHVWKS